MDFFSADSRNIPVHCKSLPQKSKPSPKPNPKYWLFIIFVFVYKTGGGKKVTFLFWQFVDSPPARAKEIKTQNNSNVGLLFTFNISFLFVLPKIFQSHKNTVKVLIFLLHLNRFICFPIWFFF